MIEVVFPQVHEFKGYEHYEGEPIEIKISFDNIEEDDTPCYALVPVKNENQKTQKQ